jgi:hypothetical protein
MRNLKPSPGDWIVNGSAVKTNFLTVKERVLCEVNLIPSVVGTPVPNKEQRSNLEYFAASKKMASILKRISLSGVAEHLEISKEIHSVLRQLEL